MEILENILKDRTHRKQLITEFQQMIWADENADSVLSDLAYDLDYYEQDDKMRGEDPSYYGDKRLEKEIATVLEKLKHR